MKIKHLTYFYEVYRCGSISKAAETLYITQQGLSKSIKSLEQAFHTELFIRTQNGVIPTSFADSIIHNVKAILEEEQSIRSKLDELMKNHESIITVSCNNMMLQVLPIGTKVKVESAAPNAAWVYFERSETDALRDVLDEKCDFAFVSTPPDTGDFHVFEILKYSLTAMVEHSNPLSRKRVLHLTDLKDQVLIPFTEQWNLHYSLLNYCSKKNFTPDTEFEAEDTIHMYTIVNNRLGIGILPSLYVNYLPQNTNVKFIPFDEDIPWNLSVISKKGRPLTPTIHLVVKALREQAQMLPKSCG